MWRPESRGQLTARYQQRACCGGDRCRTNFDSFSTAGGLGAFHEFTRAPGLNEHFLINDMQLWESTMDNFLGQL
jgi:hypothetical protein